jgi:GNAT superfamily N-acetyltransferase
MTSKLAACLPGARPLPPRIESSRGFRDGSPRHAPLAPLVRQPWMLRVGATTLTVRGADPRDLEGVASMHGRCSAQSLLERYRLGGRAISVPAMQWMLRRPLSFVAVAGDGAVRGMGVAAVDSYHGVGTHLGGASAEVGLLVEDEWQGLGIGGELMIQLAGGALVCGYTELVAYTATSVERSRRLLMEIGMTREVIDAEHPHLHAKLPEAAALGLGAVRVRLAG